MDYATKELTESLQQIAANEAEQSRESANCAVLGNQGYGAGVLTLPTGVDRFLATRRDFQERTRNVSIGSY
ncbi:hypothetical protein SH580_13220 [Coraliomargarita algicola]|uniref:Uncharacterized protein n=1 Tax=Coraliomargarita algicola TaxID=3092156 RepID=A0ABZ0RE12_9BACT|nr:hypothetical protein [Coraliomargarita sp. J2-16]WPJ94394.1 hypothetical protein SH580_13220 [Coraliomargarita sp. J2-16]